MQKQFLLRLDPEKMETLKVRVHEKTYTQSVQSAIDFALQHYDRTIKNEAMEIIDTVVTNSMRNEIQPVLELMEQFTKLQTMMRKNHGVILKELYDMKEKAW